MQTPDFYWLRQPLISLERLLAVLTGGQLTDLLKEERVAEAIRIACPSIGEHLQDNGLTDPKVAETILKYILRMGTRCTPFGLFAGGVVGYPGTVSALDFTDRELVPYHRLDTQVLVSLAYALSSQPAIRASLRYYANRSVHRVGSRLRYTEGQWRDGRWDYFTSEVPAEPHLLTVLALAQSGATIPKLIQAITTGEHQSEANAFIERLIEDSLLVSELLPAPTGPDPLTNLIQTLDLVCPLTPALLDLRNIQSLLSQSRGGPQPTPAITTILTEQLGLSLEPGCVLQTDLQINGGRNQLSGGVLTQLGRTLSGLHVLNHYNTGTSELARFRQRFYARYEEQEIPLLFALDDEVGIGYGSPGEVNPVDELLGNLLSHSSAGSTPMIPGDKLHELRLRLYSSWSPQNGPSVEITDQDLALLREGNAFVPDTYYAFGYFLAQSGAAIDAGQFQFALKALSGPTAFTMMGRFCTTDNELEKLVAAHMARQQAAHPGHLYAEIAHLHQARTGNVVQRPHLRPFEIPYLTLSSLPIEQQLCPDDLLVSVPNGQRVRLRSKRLGIDVIPQLTTAHNFHDGLPLYRFLCDLQYQEAPFAVSWHWGAFTQARRLPRVRYRNIILQEATWIFTLSDLRPAESDDLNMTRLKLAGQLPRLVAIQQADQELFLDLESSACRQLFISTLRRVKTMRVIEWLRTPDNCPVQGPDGKLTHEVILPFTNLTNSSGATPPFAGSLLDTVPKSQRSFPPGSEWLYMKVYCGPSVASTVLNQLVRVAHQAIHSGWITHWHFIRYADPEPHLRLRFRLKDFNQYGLLLVACQQGLSVFLSSGEVHRFQLDTYQRELERYGDSTIDQTEHIFWQDSETVAQLLVLNLTEPALLTAALLGVDAYQTAFGLTRPEKLMLCERLYSDLFDEHGAATSLRQSLARKYRLNHESVTRVVGGHLTNEESQLHLILEQRRQGINSYITDIRQQTVVSDQVKRLHYIGSLCHLFINRLFRDNQRTYELLIYHHLYRANQSIISRRSNQLS